MGKIVKYCSVCEEGFAEKFSFCPNCASDLITYEMNPVATEQAQISESLAPTESFLPIAADDFLSRDHLSSSDKLSAPQKYDDGIYHVAIVEDNNNLVRNKLLLSVFILMMLGTFTGVIISISTSSLNVGLINEDSIIAHLSAIDPDAIDEQQIPVAKKKKDSGGGGSGGDHDLNPASKSRDAKMLENPQFTPSIKQNTVTKPDIPIQPGVKGPETDYKEDKTQPYGIKNSIYTIPSDGPGENGGQGGGNNGGQGTTGTGPGIGPGNLGGRGGGNKGGIGPGIGPGIATKEPDDHDLPPEVKKITTAMNILVKPKATYTDSARENAIQGTVLLRVTFLANGSIGNITTISGLPNGLTEQAVAAARNIRFEPQKINGVAQNVVRQIQYTFTLF